MKSQLAPKKIKKPLIPESMVVNMCLRWLFMHGCFVWRNNTGVWKPENSKRQIRFGLVGSADIIGINPRGGFISVECKSQRGKLENSQKIFGERVRDKNGVYIVARSIDDLEANKDELLGAR